MKKVKPRTPEEVRFETLGEVRDFIEGLGFCGCGDFEAAIVFVRDILRVIKERQDIYRRENYNNEDQKQATELSERLGQLLHCEKGYGLYYSYLYFLNNTGLLEHGSSVGGSWLTKLGEQFLEAIEIYNPEEIYGED